jgi:hypothetical protein
MCGVVGVGGRWHRFEGAAESAELVVAEFGKDLCSGSVLQCAVVAFVETPTAQHLGHLPRRLGQHGVGRIDGAGQQ